MPPWKMPMVRFARWGALTLLGFVATACGDPCGNAEDRLVSMSELPCSTPGADGVWESHPLPPVTDEKCFWLEFRGCSSYEIEHPLDRVPTLVVGYTSFDADGSFSTVGSGNSFVVEEANAATVSVRNAQNQLFYLRLVLE
jgi:hypothetical protein